MWLYTYYTAECYVYQLIATEKDNIYSTIWYKPGKCNTDTLQNLSDFQTHFMPDYIKRTRDNWTCCKLKKNDVFFLETL